MEMLVDMLSVPKNTRSALVSGNRAHLSKTLLLPLSYEWQAHFGQLQPEAEVWLNYLLILADQQLRGLKQKGFDRSSLLRKKQPGLSIALSEACPQDSDFWEDYYIRRKYSAMWSKAILSEQRLSDRQFFQAIEWVYEIWFIYIDLFYHLCPRKDSEFRQYLRMSSRNFLAGWQCLAGHTSSDLLCSLLLARTPAGQKKSTLQRLAKEFLNEAIVFSADFQCPGYQKLLLDCAARAESAS